MVSDLLDDIPHARPPRGLADFIRARDCPRGILPGRDGVGAGAGNKNYSVAATRVAATLCSQGGVPDFPKCSVPQKALIFYSIANKKLSKMRAQIIF